MNKADEKSALWSILGVTRFFLAFVVMITHLCQMTGHTTSLISWWAQFGGVAAVIAFMLISGYSIAHSITTRPEGFLKRRIDRIFPVYFACLVIALVPFILYGPVINFFSGSTEAPSTVWPIFGNLFLLQGFFTERIGTLGTSWSLAIEFFFYLCAPFLVRLRCRYLMMIVLISGGAYAHFRPSDPWNLQHFMGAFLFAWCWVAGFMLYKTPNNRIVQFVVMAAGVLLLSQCDPLRSEYSTLTYLGAAAILVNAKHLTLPNARIAKLGDWLGAISYPLYLIHYPVFLLIGGRSENVQGYVYLLAASLASAALYYGVDLPYQRIARRRKVAMSQSVKIVNA